MITVPIVFAIDQNVVMQCGVTMTSLFLNAGKDTFYDVYILHDKLKLGVDSQQRLQKAFPSRDRFRISFVDVGNTFTDSEGLATGHITTATYFRLAIPALFPQFDKVIYSDIDIVFQQDLSRLYTDSLQQGELLAAALDLSIDREHYFKSKMVTSIGKSASDYFNAGFLVMNLAEMRKGDFLSQVAKHSKIKYEQNDQDVLNILCNGRVQYLPSAFNFQPSHYAGYMWGRERSDIDFAPYFKQATLHYTGPEKPWNSLSCVASDAWWHYYRQSPFFEDSFYFKRQYDQIESARNDYRKKSSKDLFTRILVNLKHFVVGK